MHFRLHVSISARKCHRKQTANPISANFRQTANFLSAIRIEYIVRQIEKSNANYEKVAYWISIGIFTFDLFHSKGEGEGQENFDGKYLAIEKDGEKIRLISNTKLRMGTRLAYLQLTLVHFTFHDATHAYFAVYQRPTSTHFVERLPVVK